MAGERAGNRIPDSPAPPPASLRPPGEGKLGPGEFLFGGERYPYFAHPYNNAGWNERRVEIPLALAALAREEGPVLEVGNVLAHYGVRGHTVVDRYEAGEGVRNVDIEAYVPEEPFGLIVSISTLEPVGWDEGETVDPEKGGRVLRRLTGELLRPGGRLLATAPQGHNPHLDRLVREGTTGAETAFLRRVNRENEWEEIAAAEAGDARYGHPFNNGNVLAVLSFRRP
jgi:hypothetical protein